MTRERLNRVIEMARLSGYFKAVLEETDEVKVGPVLRQQCDRAKAEVDATLERILIEETSV